MRTDRGYPEKESEQQSIKRVVLILFSNTCLMFFDLRRKC